MEFAIRMYYHYESDCGPVFMTSRGENGLFGSIEAAVREVKKHANERMFGGWTYEVVSVLGAIKLPRDKYSFEVEEVKRKFTDYPQFRELEITLQE